MRRMRRQHRRNKGERSRLASGQGISLLARYGGDQSRHLSTEDDFGCGSGDEGKPQGGKADGGPSSGAYEPAARDS